MFDLFVDQLGSAAIEDPESRRALLACTLVNEQFYRRASSHIFSSVSISTVHSHKRLDALRDILNANPYIARCIHSFTVEALTRCESLQVVLRQLSFLQKFGWISEIYCQFHWNKPDTPFSMIENLFNLPSLTAFHFENVMHLRLSLFSGFCHLESLSLTNVGFAKIGADTLSGSLFSSLKRLEITGALWSDEDVEAVKIIMVCAAPTLTTLILSKTMFMYGEFFFVIFRFFRLSDFSFSLSLYKARFFLNLNSIVFPVLESIQMSCLIYPRTNNTIPAFVCQLLDYSAPMVNQIKIEFEWEYIKSDQPFIFSLANGWLLLDEILSGPKYPSLNTLHLTFSSRCPIRSSGMDLGSNSVGNFLKERLPCVSSCSRIEMVVNSPTHPTV